MNGHIARISRGALTRATFAGCILALGTIAFAQQARAATFQDGTFNASSWQLNQYVSNPPFPPSNNPSWNGVVATPQTAGGNPGPYRDVSNYVAGATASMPAKVVGVHVYQSSYNPQTSGAIGSIAFSMDYRCDYPTCTVNGHLFGVALHQNGKDYITFHPSSADGYPFGISSRLGVDNLNSNWWQSPPVTGWRNTATTWQANQFCLLTAQTNANAAKPSEVCDKTQHPDFSSTALPIQCGFFTYDDVGYNASYPNYNYGEETKYDNWSCDVQPAPVPTGYVKVCKTYVDQTPSPGTTPPATFPVNLWCSNYPGNWTYPQGPWLTLNLPTTSPANCSTNNPADPSFVPPGAAPTAAGTICHVQENASAPWPTAPSNGGPLAPVLTNACGHAVAGAFVPGWAGWTTTFLPTSASGTVVAGSTLNLKVTNTLACLPTAHLRIIKRANPWPSGTTFNIQMTCTFNNTVVYSGAPPQPLSSTYPSWPVSNIPIGSQCVISEPTVPPSFVNSLGKTCTWNQQPPMTVQITGPLMNITFNNSFFCVNSPPPALTPRPAPTADRPTHPEAQQQSAACTPPATYDAERGRCVCPRDMKMQDGACVRKPEDRSILDDVHIGVGVGVGSGSGSGRGSRDNPAGRDPAPGH